MNGKQLKNSILQWAIQGKLVPQDPNDEPASILLERIRAEKERLIKEKKIKRSKNESSIFRGEDNSYYEKFEDGTVKCIDDEIPFEIPEGWEWERWGNVSYSIQYGYNAPAKPTGDILMVRISDIQNNQVVWDGVPYCDIEEKEIPTYLLRDNDILFARTGGTVGKSFLVKQVPERSIYAGYLIRTQYNTSNLCPEYLKAFMESQLYWEQLKKGTIATAQPNCNGQTLGGMLLPIPPFAEQRHITEELTLLTPILQKYSVSQDSLDYLNDELNNKLKKSILQEAIQGKLVPQDPNDEPASVLLERIRAEKERLIKEKKIKRDKNESVIYKGDDNSYYERIGIQDIVLDVEIIYPNNWLLTRLKDVCQLIDGEKSTGNYICLDAKYLRGKSEGTYLNQGRFVHKDDNIILVDGENSGEVFNVPCEGYMGSTFKQLWVCSELHLPYILYTIQFYKDLLRNSKKGAAIPHLNRDVFNNIILGIPPINEQIKIVSKVNVLFEMCR
jgi:type I restriction enzyme S subunit